MNIKKLEKFYGKFVKVTCNSGFEIVGWFNYTWSAENGHDVDEIVIQSLGQFVEIALSEIKSFKVVDENYEPTNPPFWQKVSWIIEKHLKKLRLLKSKSGEN